MRTFNIKLAGEDIELLPNYANIEKVERKVGLFELAFQIQKGTAKISDIVNVYYYMQNGTAHSQEKINEKIMADGLTAHLAQMVTILSGILTGDKNVEVKDGDEKKE